MERVSVCLDKESLIILMRGIYFKSCLLILSTLCVYMNRVRPSFILTTVGDFTFDNNKIDCNYFKQIKKLKDVHP